MDTPRGQIHNTSFKQELLYACREVTRLSIKLTLSALDLYFRISKSVASPFFSAYHGGCHLVKIVPVSLFPNIPNRQDHNLPEHWPSRVSCRQIYHVLSAYRCVPTHPQDVPTCSTESTFKKKCLLVSRGSFEHSKHDLSSPMLKCRLQSRSRVFTLSMNVSHDGSDVSWGGG